jgi:hypothetical protein
LRQSVQEIAKQHQAIVMTIPIYSELVDISLPADLFEQFRRLEWWDDGIGHKEKRLFVGNGIVLFKREWYCVDCKAQRPFIYMVTSELWEKYGNGEGIVCYSCFEKRMGRRIVEADLTDAPCNTHLKVLTYV